MSQGKVLFFGWEKLTINITAPTAGGEEKGTFHRTEGEKGAAADYSSIQGGDGSFTLTQRAAGDNRNDTAAVACALLHFYGMSVDARGKERYLFSVQGVDFFCGKTYGGVFAVSCCLSFSTSAPNGQFLHFFCRSPPINEITASSTPPPCHFPSKFFSLLFEWVRRTLVGPRVKGWFERE